MSLLQLAGLQQSAAGGSAPVADLLWLDAKTGITLRGTSPDRISTWTDQSVNGHVMLTDASATSPIVDSAYQTLNGYNIPWSSGDDWLYLDAAVGMAANQGALSVYLVVYDEDAAMNATTFLCGERRESSTSPIYGLSSAGSSSICGYIRNDSSSNYLSVTGSGAHYPTAGYGVVSWVDDSGSSEYWVDGSHAADADNPKSYTAAGTLTTDTFAVGGIYRSGAVSNIAVDWAIAELRIYGAAHDDTTRGLVETEMTDRWGL